MRLLQAASNTTTATNTTVAPVATGTGDFEGWSAGFLTASRGFNSTFTTGPVAITNEYNSWGRVSGVGSRVHYSTFLGADKTATVNSQPW